LGCLFFSSSLYFMSCCALIIYLNNLSMQTLFFLIESVLQQRFHANLVRWQMGIFARYFKCIQ
jgi:hypothetical protein